MISRPTTEQILIDCAREIREAILPAVDDPALQVRLQMLELLLQSSAVRSAHEIAWMADETVEMEDFTASMAASTGDPELIELLAGARRDRSEDRTLRDQVANYDRAGRAFSAAVALAVNGTDSAAAARARQLILHRSDRERDCRPGFYFPGRT